ncbi:ProQ/FINO family protein [Rhizobium ruizarguesonis]
MTLLRRATSAYTHSKRYFFACAQPDAYRHDIDGNAIAPITADDRIAAQLAFSKLKNSPTEGPSPAILGPDLVRYRDQRRQGHARNVTNCFAPNLLILKVNDPRHPKLPPSDLKDLQAMPAAGRRSTWI